MYTNQIKKKNVNNYGNCYTENDFMSIFNSTGSWPASYCHGVVSVVRLSVRASVNSSFKRPLRNYGLDFLPIFTGMFLSTLLHYGSLPFTSVVGSESRPSSRGIFVT